MAQKRKRRRLLKPSTKLIILYGSPQSSKSALKMLGTYGFGSNGSIDLMNYPAVVNLTMAEEKSSNHPFRTLFRRTQLPATLMLLIGKKWMTQRIPMVLTASSGGRHSIPSPVNSV